MTREERRADAKKAYAALMKGYPFMLENLDGEEWADIPNYEELYQVSTFGRVKSFKRYREGKILRPHLGRSGYLQVELWKDKKGTSFLISRLVAFCFIRNSENKPQVDHIDGHPMNNHVSNLRWATGFENTNFAVELGLIKSGEDCYQAKLTNEQVQYIRENPDRLSQVQLAEVFNVIQATISAIQLGAKYKSAGGQVRESKIKRVPANVREQIRSEYIRGSSEFGSYGLARKYGVCKQTVLRIVSEE